MEELLTLFSRQVRIERLKLTKELINYKLAESDSMRLHLVKISCLTRKIGNIVHPIQEGWLVVVRNCSRTCLCIAEPTESHA